MKLPDILNAFHRMPACDRLDLICRLLRSCVPYELRFLGTVILDAARAQMKSFAATEVVANQVNHYSGFKDGGVTHVLCEKLCCALAVVHANNQPVAETIFGLLNNPQALQLFEETSELKVLDDLRLLYVMAVNHPALSYNQRQHLLYMFLQRMDTLNSEKSKFNFTGSYTSSVEKSSEGDSCSGTLRREPSKDAGMTYCDVHSVYKRPTDKRYAYMIQVEWSDGTSCCVRRTYGDFYSFHTKLLDQFPGEGGQRNKKDRMIPFLPGKSYPRILTNRNNRDLAEKRLPELHRYAKELISLPERISQCCHVLEFFRPRSEDLKEEYPSVQKITTLYDLLESGKARLRNYSEPLSKGSSKQSPRPLRSSPLDRATGETPSSSPQSRSAHTLPHHSSSSTSQPKEESGLERRFTYPSRRSAFTPVTPPQQPQAPPTSTHLTNSHPHIPNGGSPSAATETAATETVAVTTQPVATTSTTITPALPPSTSSPVTNHTFPHSAQPTYSPHSAMVTSTICTISHPPTSTGHTSSTSHYKSSGVAKPTPTYAHSYQSTFTTITSPTKSLTTPHITHSHIHHPPITPSPPPIHSGKTTPLGEILFPIAPQFVPVGLPMPLRFTPVSQILIGYSSPIHSPSPSPLTPRGKSSSNISRTPTEFESLSRWLKNHRLHKYAHIFENMTFDELLSLDKDALKKKGMTEGAANKLVAKIEELKTSNFSGFRDMPYNPRMSRKPSTCSLPAALMAERGVTPCSSVDGLSPTDSTCSLDKAATLVRDQPGRPEPEVYSPDSSASQDASAMASIDAAILKAVPSSSTATDNSLNLSAASSKSVKSPLQPSHHHLHTLTSPSTSDVQSDSSSTVIGSDISTATAGTLTRVSTAGETSELSRSWADRLDTGEEEEEERHSSAPEWAQLQPEGAKGHSHTPLTKQHSAEARDDGRSHTHNGPATTRPHHYHHHQHHPSSHTGPRNHPHHASPAGWSHRQPALLQNSHVGVHTAGSRLHTQYPLPQPQFAGTPVGVNGLVHSTAAMLRPGYPPAAVGLVPAGYPTVMSNQGRGTHHPPPPACFNCGKKGHHGRACPAETMDANNPDMFHKQLEGLAAKHSSHNSHTRA